MPLSAVIITLNEEENLPRCLQSVRELASEIIVIDSGSSDRTSEVAAHFGAIFEVRAWQGHVNQKNYALGQSTQPWALCLDADEALSAELAASIRQTFINGEPRENGFLINRRTFYLGDWIRHAWQPEWRLRLVRKAKARWVGPVVHERLEAEGQIGKLSGDLLHYPFRNLDENLRRWIKYARLIAEEKVRQKRKFKWYQLVVYPWLEFFKRLIMKQSWRDGWRGWLIAFGNMMYVFAKYAFVLEKELASRIGLPVTQESLLPDEALPAEQAPK